MMGMMCFILMLCIINGVQEEASFAEGPGFKKKKMLSNGELEKAVEANPSHQGQLEISSFADLFTSKQ